MDAQAIRKIGHRYQEARFAGGQSEATHHRHGL
jgi:hypothetical protein